MASWQDGPEYAPQERPAAFVVPQAPPLVDPETTAPALPSVPGGEPSFTPPTQEQPDLAALVPSAAPGRNPNLPFDVLTVGGAGVAPEALLERAPELPFNASGPSMTGYLAVQPTLQPNAQVNPAPFPAPGTPQWFAPPPESRVPSAPPTVTVSQIWTAASAGVMIPLLVGIFFSWLSILMIAVSFALSARIAYRRPAIRRAYVVALAMMGALGLLAMLTNGYDSDLLFASLSNSAQLACFLLPVVIGLIVGGALRNGERPDRSN